MHKIKVAGLLLWFLTFGLIAQEKGRIRSFGVEPYTLEPGPWNAITDVQDVRVGHTTLIDGDSVRTGVTVILPHGGNVFQEKVPAAVSVGNGFGKAIGFTQVEELGNLETPIALSNTLSVFSIADALVDYTLSIKGNTGVRSVNPVAGETNDGWLSDIRGKHVKKAHVLEAIRRADSGPVEEGNVGAGTGTRCLGYKGGVGTSSRLVPFEQGAFTVGVLVQTNFGGTHPACRIPYKPEQPMTEKPELGNDFMSPLFLAVVEAVEEAIYNSLFMAEDMSGRKGRFMPALPIKKTLEIMDRHVGIPVFEK